MVATNLLENLRPWYRFNCAAREFSVAALRLFEPEFGNLLPAEVPKARHEQVGEPQAVAWL